MGIIIRKSLATTIFSYIGVVIGYLNFLYLFPKFLSPSQIGLYRLILDSAILLAPFAQSGIMQGIIKFYPARLQHQQKKEFELFALLFLMVSLAFFSGVFLLLEEGILNFLFSGNESQVRDFYHFLLFLIVVLSLFAFFEGFSKANTNIVLVNFLKDVYIRLLTTLSVFLYFQEFLDYEKLLYSLVVIYGSAAFILSLYTIRKLDLTAKSNLSSLTLPKAIEILMYNFFMVISAGSSLVVGKIDSLMISAFLGLAENGIYQVMFFVAVVVEIPKRVISQVAISLFSKAFAKDNLQEVRNLYSKTALNQLIIGLLLYIGIIINLHNLFYFIPNGEEYLIGKWVVVIIGLSRVIDMAAGANGELIVMSRHYYFNVVAIASLALLTVLTNYLLIPIFGINGAAIASLLSLILFNLVKMVYIWKTLGIQPFNKNNIAAIGIGAFTFILGYFLPALENHFLDLLYRSFVVTIIYAFLIIRSKISEDINNFLTDIWVKFRK